MTDPKREAILAAAQVQFSRYGFRRTSMADIAKEAGVSRALLYTGFDNKEEIFRSLTASLQERCLEDAERHLKEEASVGGDLAARVRSALLARIAPFMEIVSSSAHGGELNDENNRLCGDLVAQSSERFRRMLATALAGAARAGEIDLKAADLTAPAAAELIHRSAIGLKQGAPDLATVERRLERFTRVFFQGLGSR